MGFVLSKGRTNLLGTARACRIVAESSRIADVASLVGCLCKPTQTQNGNTKSCISPTCNVACHVAPVQLGRSGRTQTRYLSPTSRFFPCPRRCGSAIGTIAHVMRTGVCAVGANLRPGVTMHLQPGGGGEPDLREGPAHELHLRVHIRDWRSAFRHRWKRPRRWSAPRARSSPSRCSEVCTTSTGAPRRGGKPHHHQADDTGSQHRTIDRSYSASQRSSLLTARLARVRCPSGVRNTAC
jgi:hypothetical protein